VSREPTDAELLRRARRDPDAFRALYDRYSEPVYGFLVRRTHDEAAALELTAETFAAAWIGRRRFEDRAGGSAAPWLFGIARNLLARSVRQRSVERRAQERLGLELTQEPAPAADSWLDGDDGELRLALASLGGGEREAIELRVIEDLDYGGVARRLGISTGAARVRVFRGLGRLRRRLDPSTLGGTE
jgi:RNA polymerase sigma-70 factor (ECF subfamily)